MIETRQVDGVCRRYLGHHKISHAIVTGNFTHFRPYIECDYPTLLSGFRSIGKENELEVTTVYDG